MARSRIDGMPVPTPIFRIIHVTNLHVYLTRDRLHAPNHMPDDGLPWKRIEDKTVQAKRYEHALQKGPGGTVLDYVPFYFGPRSPMLLRLATKWKVDYDGTQNEIIYLCSTIEEMVTKNRKFVFTNGHALAAYSDAFDDLADLDKVDWQAVYADTWRNTPSDNDREARKQAEFLVHKSCGWRRILEIGVMTPAMKSRVKSILDSFPASNAPAVCVRPEWFYSGK